MELDRKIAALASSDEERMLLVRVCERLERAEQRCQPAATFFLTPRERALVRQLLPQTRFFGGMEDSERTVACYLPDYMTEEAFFENGPIACLRAAFYGKDMLTHRDILGALMGTGLRRDAVGDIWVQQGQCDFFVLSELVPYLMDNLTSAGRTALHVEQIPLSAAQRPPQRMRRLRITVSSPRLDGVLSAAFPLSRAGAAQAVTGGRVSLNDICCLKPDKQLAPGDVIALRGRGKLKVLSLDGETKKGRQAFTIGIYE